MNFDSSHGTVTEGGGVAATIAGLHSTRGPGWQTRVNAALKEWLATEPPTRKTRSPGAVESG